LARQQARRRNRELLSGIALAVLGLVVLAVAVFAIRNPRGGSPAAAQTPSSSSPPASASRSAGRSASSSIEPTDVVPITASSTGLNLAQAQRVPLVVLNNTTISGLATQAAHRFEAAGWHVTSVGNLVNDIISTCAYYDPSVANAKAAAKALKHEFPTIKRVRPKFPQLPPGPVVVVLTPDYAPQ
jgi:hypothetical protein